MINEMGTYRPCLYCSCNHTSTTKIFLATLTRPGRSEYRRVYLSRAAAEAAVWRAEDRGGTGEISVCLLSSRVGIAAVRRRISSP